MDPDVIARVAERKIQEAIEEGKFDNLPGKGQPLVFDDDPMTPPHLRVANRILKNAHVLPDWMQVHKEIGTEQQEVRTLRARLIHANQQRRAPLLSLPVHHAGVGQFAEWHASSRSAYQGRLKNINNLILKLSLLAPSTVQPIAPYKIDREMAAFDEEFPPLPQQSALPAAPEPTQGTGRLKSIARERYHIALLPEQDDGV